MLQTPPESLQHKRNTMLQERQGARESKGAADGADEGALAEAVSSVPVTVLLLTFS